MNNWWTDEDRAAFVAKTKVLADQYSEVAAAPLAARQASDGMRSRTFRQAQGARRSVRWPPGGRLTACARWAWSRGLLTCDADPTRTAGRLLRSLSLSKGPAPMWVRRSRTYVCSGLGTFRQAQGAQRSDQCRQGRRLTSVLVGDLSTSSRSAAVGPVSAGPASYVCSGLGTFRQAQGAQRSVRGPPGGRLTTCAPGPFDELKERGFRRAQGAGPSTSSRSGA